MKEQEQKQKAGVKKAEEKGKCACIREKRRECRRLQMWLSQGRSNFEREAVQEWPEIINPSVCGMGFGTYEEDVLEGAGAHWISCACGRWLHEDYAEECRIDSDGEERFCHVRV